MKQFIIKTLCALLCIFYISFGSSAQEPTQEQEPIELSQEEQKEKENPGALFWVACIVAGTLPWVFIYYMKKKKRW